LLDNAAKKDMPQPLLTAVMTFDPHPNRVLADPGYQPLYTSHERENIVSDLGLDYLLEYPFSVKLANLSPTDFCNILFNDLQARIIVVGEGYRFGKNRAGTIETLRTQAAMYSAHIYEVPYTIKTSTSAIRVELSAGNLAQATTFLGRPFFVMGTVTPGRRLGRTMGFATNNIYPPDDKFLPPHGVYCARVTTGGRSYNGITNIGVRPTVEGAGVPRSVETHLLDYTGPDMYGAHIQVELLQFIRPEKRFSGLEALKAQIEMDCQCALRFFHSYNSKGAKHPPATIRP